MEGSLAQKRICSAVFCSMGVEDDRGLWTPKNGLDVLGTECNQLRFMKQSKGSSALYATDIQINGGSLQKPSKGPKADISSSIVVTD